MKVTKILETRLDILNDDMYCCDYNARILRILNDNYINRCFKSIFILDIIRIIRRSAPHCKNKALDGSAYIDISFEVSGIVYDKGDVIHNCKIIKIDDNGKMHAKSKYASIHVNGSNSLVSFKETDEITVLVRNAGYGINDTEISVSTIPFVPIIKDSIIYKIVDDEDKSKDKSEDKYIDNFIKDIEQIEKQLVKHKKTNPQIFKFFKELVYPYKTYKVDDFGKSYDISMINLLKLKKDDMVFKPCNYLDDNTYLLINDKDKIKVEKTYTTTIIEISKQDYILHIFNLYKTNLLQLIGFVESYDTKDKITASQTTWKLYNTVKHKKP
jgi:hypothetical protein